MQINGPLKIGELQLVRLSFDHFRPDGGVTYGAVPKVLWKKNYPVDAKNSISMCNNPLLIKTSLNIFLFDSGLGKTSNVKQKYIFNISGEWDMTSQLEGRDIRLQDL